MAGRTPAQEKALIAKAMKAGSKSAGMRELLEAGMSVSEVAAAFDAPYGFAYGVARRAGLITPTERAPKATAKAKAPRAAAAKASAKAAPRTARTAKAAGRKAPAKAKA